MCRGTSCGQSPDLPGPAGLTLTYVTAHQTMTHTSVSVVLETFTFLDRQTMRDVAIEWRHSLTTIPRLHVWPVTPRDLADAWVFFDRADLHKLSAVEAVGFVLMRRAKIRFAFAFDHHFATAGFR